MKSKVYTLTGDKGTTSLVGGQRVAKDDIRVEAYGTVDELNAHIGMLAHAIKGKMPEVEQLIFKIQNKLFNLGAYLATEQKDAESPVYGLSDDDVKAVEAMIDTLDEQLPPMRGFILPGGTQGLGVLRHMPHRHPPCRAPCGDTCLPEASQPPGAALPQPPERLLLHPRPPLQRASNVEEVLWDKNSYYISVKSVK